jgi:hypothetical protein
LVFMIVKDLGLILKGKGYRFAKDNQ